MLSPSGNYKEGGKAFPCVWLRQVYQTGFRPRQVKVILYADDMLLLLGDSDHSLQNIMSTIQEYGIYFGLAIIWTKSALLQMNYVLNPQLPLFCHVPCVLAFKYLGIIISRNLTDYCRLKILPLISRFREWRYSPNLVKI